MATDHHHDSALYHIATALLTRIATGWHTDTRYVITDIDGTPITAEEGRRIVREHHQGSRARPGSMPPTVGNPNAGRVDRTGSGRSRRALQHPGPPVPPQDPPQPLDIA